MTFGQQGQGDSQAEVKATVESAQPLMKPPIAARSKARKGGTTAVQPASAAASPAPKHGGPVATSMQAIVAGDLAVACSPTKAVSPKVRAHRHCCHMLSLTSHLLVGLNTWDAVWRAM